MTETLYPNILAGHLNFSLCDPVHRASLGDQLQVHLIELSKYHVREADLDEADWLQRWIYFLSDSANHDADELRRLLPDSPFQKATGILEMIARSPELRLVYDDRAKEAKDRFSEIKDARMEGKAEGKLVGRIQAIEDLLGLPKTDEATLSELPQDKLAELAMNLEQRFVVLVR